MSTSTNPALAYVAPSIGGVLGVVMLLSPARAVLRLRRTQTLGDINPLPYPMTVLNCVAWIVYATVVKDPFIAPPNVIGAVGGVWFTLTALPLCVRKMQDLIQGLFIVAAFVFGLLSMIGTFVLDGDQAAQKNMWGALCIAILLVYYTIPLSCMVQIVRTRNAASIYLPLTVTAILNGTCWTIYGIAVGDPIIWGPNAFGAAMGLVQVGLRLRYGSVKRDMMEIRDDAAHTAAAVGDVAAGIKEDPAGAVEGAAGIAGGAIKAFASAVVAAAVAAAPPQDVSTAGDQCGHGCQANTCSACDDSIVPVDLWTGGPLAQPLHHPPGALALAEFAEPLTANTSTGSAHSRAPLLVPQQLEAPLLPTADASPPLPDAPALAACREPLQANDSLGSDLSRAPLLVPPHSNTPPLPQPPSATVLTVFPETLANDSPGSGHSHAPLLVPQRPQSPTLQPQDASVLTEFPEQLPGSAPVDGAFRGALLLMPLESRQAADEAAAIGGWPQHGELHAAEAKLYAAGDEAWQS